MFGIVWAIIAGYWIFMYAVTHDLNYIHFMYYCIILGYLSWILDKVK